MIEWPTWAVYAVVGGVLGAAGAAAGFLLEKAGLKLGRYAAIAALAATPIVSREYVLPGILNAYSNKDLPMKLDEYTTLIKIEYDDKKYVYHYTLSDDVPPDFDVNLIKSDGITGMCDYWRSSFADGEVRSAEYRYLFLGANQSFFVTPADC